ncbi:hypothetical protein EK904_013803 [Melospiza melodia maxima]|nr:hypothetical protein EK904_013803 [Melospiza melodia maxima]
MIHDLCCFSGQELYQLSKEKADFSVTAGEEDESTAGSSGENDGNSRSSTPHSSIKSPPSKSPAKAQKAEDSKGVIESPQKSEERRGEKRKASEMEDNGKKTFQVTYLLLRERLGRGPSLNAKGVALHGEYSKNTSGSLLASTK